MKIGNLLSLASSLIPLSNFQYLEFLGNVINNVGQKVPTYKDPINAKGSIQSVDTVLFERLGLDTTKEYKLVYTYLNLSVIKAGSSADKIVYNNTTYQALTRADWLSYNGWTGVICVKV